MKRLIARLIITALFPISALAQALNVISATEQNWSGGIAGHYGTRYSIQLKVKGDNIGIDSVYFGNKGFVPNATQSGEVGTSKDTTERMYSINAEEYHNENAEHVFKSGKEGYVQSRFYDGDALIVYELNGKKNLFIIKEVERLPAIAYP